MISKYKNSKYLSRFFLFALIFSIAIPVALQALTFTSSDSFRVFVDVTENRNITTSVKKFEDGMYAYCLERTKVDPDNGTNIEPSKEITDENVWKTLKYGYPNQKWYDTGDKTKDEKLNYYVTQVTMWYFIEGWDMSKIDNFRQAEGNSQYEAIKTDLTVLKKHIKSLISQVEGDKGSVAPELSFSKNEVALAGNSSLETESELITLNGSNLKGNAKVVLTGAPEGTYIKNENGEKTDNIAIGGKFKIVVPSDAPATKFTYSVEGEGETLKAIEYDSAEKQDVVKYDEVKVKLPTAAKGTINWTPGQVKASVSIAKVNSETGEPLAGAKFTLSQNGNVLHEVTTGEDGRGVIKDIANGTYQIQEVVAPTGFIIDPEVKEITVTQGDHGKTFEISAPNAPIKGGVELVKKDAEDSEKVLDGVKFELYSVDGNSTVTEEGTQGEEQDSKPVEDSTPVDEATPVDESNPNDEQTSNQDEEQTTNPNEEQSTEGQESASEDSENLLTEEQQPLEDGSKLIGIYATNSEGKIKVSDLTFGKYYFKEVETKEGYVLDSTPINFEITENDQLISLEKTNKKITGELEITKVDISTGDLLPDATFAIYDESGEEVIVKGKTDENGTAKFKLDYGKYYYQEIDAPDGYMLDSTKFPFEIKNDGEIVKCKMTNSKLPKTGTVPGYIGILAPIGILGVAGLVAFRKR